jgi:regulator of sirC expression with transglutaminase-like and TPR domain
MTPADRLAAAEARAAFAAEVSKPGAEIDLARAALLAGKEEEPRECNVERCLARLDELGEQARWFLRNEELMHVAGSQVGALNDFLFGANGFKGNISEYYDPRNSMLHRVLERRLGIPITLSIVYIEVGRRAGLRVEGVGLPGHFVVRAYEPDSGEGVLVDPFNCKVTDEEECRRRLDGIYEGAVKLGPEHLRATGTRAILGRVLGNLKAVYVQARLFQRALAAVERTLLVNPNDLEERRDRGMLLAQLNRMNEAIEDTQKYLNLSPDAPDADSVREQLTKMQSRLAMLN